jgi:hypothetical protein
MPTVRTVTVKSSGGDYSSLSAAEAGEQGDLVSLDRQLDIECYSFADTTNVAINGWTTDATRYIRIFTPPAERHDGKWNTSKYRLTAGTAFNRALQVVEGFVRLEGLQIEYVYSAVSANMRPCVDLALDATGDVRIDACIIQKGGRPAAGAGGNGVVSQSTAQSKVTITNSVIYGGIEAGVSIAFGATMDILNCTIVGNTTHGILAHATGSTVAVTNTYSGGSATDAYSGTMTLTTCMHDTATSFTGSTGSIPYDTSNFTNVTGGSEDLHLVSGSDLIDAGTDLGTTPTGVNIDIDGRDRDAEGDTWDIGADEFVSLAAAFLASSLIILNMQASYH